MELRPDEQIAMIHPSKLIAHKGFARVWCSMLLSYGVEFWDSRNFSRLIVVRFRQAVVLDFTVESILFLSFWLTR